jgi:SAM-dependent methyltransferase
MIDVDPVSKIRNIKVARHLFEWRALRFRNQPCTLCGFSFLVKFGSNEHAVRCLRCSANPAAMSLAETLVALVPDLANRSVYELSSRGPLFKFLQQSSAEFNFSEYFDDVKPGNFRNGVLCQDIQHLTFPDRSFDVCTSTDVLEHVPNDVEAFGEIHRVLKPGGFLVFTVPLDIQRKTQERARVVGGQVEHLLSPEFHDDHVRGLGQVLCFRNYGGDIIDRLSRQGFTDVEIVPPDDARWWGYGRPVVVARR